MSQRFESWMDFSLFCLQRRGNVVLSAFSYYLLFFCMWINLQQQELMIVLLFELRMKFRLKGCKDDVGSMFSPPAPADARVRGGC